MRPPCPPPPDPPLRGGGGVASSGPGPDPDNNPPLSYQWNFGDASAVPATSGSATPGAVQFNTPGTYTVSFTVSDALGLADPTPATRTVTVANPGVGVIPQSTWSLVSVDSQETIGENGQAGD